MSYFVEKINKEDKLYEPNQNDLPSAYLGPQIWNDMLLSDDLKLEPVDLEDLLDGSNGDEEVSVIHTNPKNSKGLQIKVYVIWFDCSYINSLGLFPFEKGFMRKCFILGS